MHLFKPYLRFGTLAAALILAQCTQENDLANDTSFASADVKTSAMATVALSDKEMLGKRIFFDRIASMNNMSCATCHAPEYGFTGPNTGVNITSGIYRGSVATRYGNRKPPSAAYATFSPAFHYEESEELFVGGNFWDGRATGEHLGSPSAEQALGPFLNPVEQNMPSKEAVLKQIERSAYAPLWNQVWGPLSYSTPEEIESNYNKVGFSIAAYEGSQEVNAFSSKFDYYLKNQVKLTAEELWGLELFNGKGKCNLCHPSDGEQPLFTDFTFDNLGVPKNPRNPFYNMNTVYLGDGTAINPEGAAWIDPGLGGFLAKHPDPVWQSRAAENWGKHKVPTLRNVDRKPGNTAVKAYMHNGVFRTLKEVVHFYNTRDTESWPAPEVAENVNVDELGNLELTDAEENAIVAFMKTLSDGYVIKPSDKK